MLHSSSAKQLIYPSAKKITNRNPVFRSSSSFAELPSSRKPFSRKPSILLDDPSMSGSKFVENDLDTSLMDRSRLEVESVMSGERSVRESKFVRTNRSGFLSPKSKSKKKGIELFEETFSPESTFGTQSMITKTKGSQMMRCLKKDSINQNQSMKSDQSSGQKNENYLQKSTSSSTLYRRGNKTRNMILSKFSEMARNSKEKPVKNKLNTSIHASCYENERQERNRIQRMNIELKEKNDEKQKQCENLENQNTILAKENVVLKNEITQLKKKLQQLQSSIGSTSTIPQKLQSQTNLYQSSVQKLRPSIPLPVNQSKKCQKCEQKQKSNQKQVTYFQNIIKKKQTELVALRRKQAQLTKENSDLKLSLDQERYKFNELLENQKIATQNQQKLQECVNQLKQEVARLKDELRYLKIENSVLLKIKNEHLKLKIDITKIQDERDYFKMKIIEIHKKNGSFQPNNSKKVAQKFIREKSEINRKQTVLNKSKKFYLDSTQTEETDNFDTRVDKKHTHRTRSEPSESRLTLQIQVNRGSKKKVSEQETSLSSSSTDALFDLTSEESESSY